MTASALPLAIGTFVEVDGRAIHVRRDGAETGAPTLLFAHALGSDHRVWDGVVRELGERPSLRYDLGGHGLSEAPDGERTIAGLARELDGVMDAAGIERAVLVGVSVGGQVALRQALDRPERVIGLVACDTAARIGTRDAWQARIDTVHEHGLAGLARDVIARWFTADFAQRHPARLRGHRTLLARTPADGYAGVCAALRDEDLSPRLPDIAARTLVLCGAEDEPTPPAQARALAEGLPHARYREIADAAHLPPVERPAPVARAIAQFLEEDLHA